MKARHVQTMGGEWVRVYDADVVERYLQGLADDVRLVLHGCQAHGVRFTTTGGRPYVVELPPTARRGPLPHSLHGLSGVLGPDQ